MRDHRDLQNCAMDIMDTYNLICNQFFNLNKDQHIELTRMAVELWIAKNSDTTLTMRKGY